jgi:hypothetical protein
MAVTITTADLEQPEGELSESLFPGGDFATLLAGWLAQAEAKVEGNTAIATANHNLAAAEWVYYRAYDHVAQRLAASPVRVSTSLDGSIAKEMAQDQRKYWIEKATAKKAAYEGYETESASTTSVIPAFFGRVRASTTIGISA